MTRTSKIQAVVAVVLALALTSVMVLRTTSAAFTDTTDNASNSWDAGSVTLTDNDSGSALFSATGLVPGDSSTGCIEVTYGGSLTLSTAADLYAAVTETTVGGNGLGDDLDVVVERGAATDTCALMVTPTTVYSGTLAAFNTLGSPLATGWTPGSGDTMRPFKFTVTLGNDTANDAQGEGADATFTWSVTS